MSINKQTSVINTVRGTSGIGVVAVALLVGMTAFVALFAGETTGAGKVVGISWVAFAAMAGAAPLGARSAGNERALTLVWGYGLASGAMVTSAAVFLLPQAFGLHPKIGGFGVAAGLLAGFGAHTVGHRFTHVDFGFDHTAIELSAHALSAGAIIGIIYGNMPELGPLLGLAIVSHKGPAGYAAARRLAADGRSVSVLLLPAAGVGLTAIPSALIELPANQTVNAAVFGFAAGVFLHVAMDFLPECELGGEVYEVAQVSDDAHSLLDRLRLHAVGSTAVGAVVVFLAWLSLS
ncbi:ZIP family metal transporter [Halostella salina]|uniref:ZIP family metal transporter n=1 Tax=Halostella salina TaxID=1547897 RepID=UPI000EF805ED|nr:ZIP family metal transporter [Halostella salina]